MSSSFLILTCHICNRPDISSKEKADEWKCPNCAMASKLANIDSLHVTRNNNLKEFNPDWRVAPGKYIWEEMYEREMAPIDLSFELNLTLKNTWKLLKGDLPLTEDMAEKLGKVFDVSAQIFLNLEKNFRKPKP